MVLLTTSVGQGFHYILPSGASVMCRQRMPRFASRGRHDGTLTRANMTGDSYMRDASKLPFLKVLHSDILLPGEIEALPHGGDALDESLPPTRKADRHSEGARR